VDPQVLRALHVIGVIAWIGGTVVAGLAVALVEETGRTAAAAGARRALLYVSVPGLLVAWIFGLWILLPNFGDLYAKAAWMHTKLTVALVVTGLMGLLTGRLRKMASGAAPPTPGMPRGVALAVLVLAAVAVFLAQLQPG
jgi:uncharacterized membrane protein